MRKGRIKTPTIHANTADATTSTSYAFNSSNNNNYLLSFGRITGQRARGREIAEFAKGEYKNNNTHITTTDATTSIIYTFNSINNDYLFSGGNVSGQRARGPEIGQLTKSEHTHQLQILPLLIVPRPQTIFKQ